MKNDVLLITFLHVVTLASGCGGTLTAPPEGIVTSPNYPNDYGTNETCEVSVDPINSTSNKMFLRFSSDESVTAHGFQFNYRATPISNARCGGLLTAPPKDFAMSPNYPNYYGNDLNCEWTITVPDGNRVRLTFLSFQLENADSLTIYDKDATPTSATGCGGNLTAPPVGNVTSPNYPNDYGNEENCDWTITVPEGNIVRLTFDSFVAEVDFDFLFVYDGDGDTAAPLQRLTGDRSSVYVPTVTSTSTQMFVRFTSDESITAQGFQFSYIAKPGCGGNLTAPPVGIVTSPNFPNDYDNEENCDWTITVTEGNKVRLILDSFVTEVDFDILSVYDGNSDTAAPLQRLTGDMSAVYVPTITSTSTQMFVRFTSDGSNTAQGFQFSYIATPTSGTGCGGNLTAPPVGIVTSPNYPNDYGNEENCDWTLTVPEGNIVRLTFDSFVTEVDYDFLFVYDGDSDTAAQLQRLTGELPGYPIISTSHEMFVRFTSDGWGTRQGFQFTVTEAYSPRCGGNLAVPPEGTVSYPGHYSTYATCEWTITAPEGSYVRLTFASFHFKDTDDSLTIYDGNSSSGRFIMFSSLTGDMSVYPVTSTSNQMFVRLTTSNYTEDDYRQEFQFTATEISALGCGGTLTAPPEGNVTSPNYPDNYGNDQTCEWTITVPEGTYIHLTFSSFNLDEGSDFLTIYKRNGDSASLVHR
ncbi:cubilin-like [Branchiostoma lanceolatum]|uniref:cubilin-like n=1 Tax=Branchiostoma lanceolatum TaxID=7740 RepID=UPI0034531739